MRSENPKERTGEARLAEQSEDRQVISLLGSQRYWNAQISARRASRREGKRRERGDCCRGERAMAEVWLKKKTSAGVL